MRARLACLLFIILSCDGMWSDANQEQKAKEEELLSSLFSSKVGWSLWRAVLLNVCGRISQLDQQGEEVWLGTGESHAYTQFRFHLMDLCRLLLPGVFVQRVEEQPDANQVEDKETYHKRKSPYILKRQLHTEKARRPYLLKRSTAG